MHQHGNFHGTQAWRKKSAAILKRDNYQDQLLLREGITEQAELVHHIFPADKYPEYAIKNWNLISITRETHGLLHDPMGGLSKLGKMLMMETAEKNNLELSIVTLVCGLPGSGKTTFVKLHLGDGLVYDLDYIAGAFRLKNPHAEEHPAARKMANSMLRAFVHRAKEEVGRVWVVRTAPTISELDDIRPDRIYIMERGGRDLSEERISELNSRIEELKEWAEANDIPYECVSAPITV